MLALHYWRYRTELSPHTQAPHPQTKRQPAPHVWPYITSSRDSTANHHRAHDASKHRATRPSRAADSRRLTASLRGKGGERRRAAGGAPLPYPHQPHRVDRQPRQHLPLGGRNLAQLKRAPAPATEPLQPRCRIDLIDGRAGRETHQSPSACHARDRGKRPARRHRHGVSISLVTHLPQRDPTRKEPAIRGDAIMRAKSNAWSIIAAVRPRARLPSNPQLALAGVGQAGSIRNASSLAIVHSRSVVETPGFACNPVVQHGVADSVIDVMTIPACIWLCRSSLLNEHEAVAVGVAERKHRWYEVTHPHDLSVRIDALGEQGSVVRLGVNGAEADAGVDCDRRALGR